MLYNTIMHVGTKEKKQVTLWWLCTGAFSLHDVSILIFLSSASSVILLIELSSEISVVAECTSLGIILKSVINVGLQLTATNDNYHCHLVCGLCS